MHFQIVAAGAVVFLVVLIWLTNMPPTNSIAIASERLVIGLQTTGCYLAFVSMIFAHRCLRRNR